MAHSSVYARNLKNKKVAEKPVLTVKQVAARLNCSTRHVYNLINENSLKCFKIGVSNGIRVYESDLEKIMTGPKGVV